MSTNVMQGVLGLLAVGCVLALVGPAAADFTPKNSADFDWKYDMDAKPSDTDLDTNLAMDFTELGTGGSSSVLDGILTMNTSVSGSFYYDNAAANQTWQLDSDITHVNGYTYEVRLQITGGTTPQGFVFLATTEGDNAFAWLNVAHNGQSWASGGTNEPPLVPLGEAADNTDAFHVFRVAQAPGEAVYSVWRDGVLLSDSLGTGFVDVAADKIAFGDVGWNWGGDVDVDYFRFISGAWAPDDTPPPPIPGDANLDRIVNDADASILAAHWQQSGMGWGDGDFNGDNVVNDADASILAAHWQETQEGAVAVPEPSVLVLLFGAGLFGLLARARRRR